MAHNCTVLNGVPDSITKGLETGEAAAGAALRHCTPAARPQHACCMSALTSSSNVSAADQFIAGLHAVPVQRRLGCSPAPDSHSDACACPRRPIPTPPALQVHPPSQPG